jgi:hypothetical protein
MKINEVESPVNNNDQLIGLVQFLKGRAEDTGAESRISQNAFINMAQSMNLNINKSNLNDVLSQPPLSNLVEPSEGDDIVFKGSKVTPTKMPVDKARDIVSKAAKSAMKRGLNK